MLSMGTAVQSVTKSISLLFPVLNFLFHKIFRNDIVANKSAVLVMTFKRKFEASLLSDFK